ncbi:MAG: hypothetical protein IPJ88_01340 [Myxococcales bacterium]|nr:MAG: hypothetical protein IPJ88_01340 [Myxococcales bacterium]
MENSTKTASNLIDELAGSCVSFVKRALDLELDFTSETLPIVDHYLREHTAAVAKNSDSKAYEEVVSLIAPAAGAYFGTVVQRELKQGRWFCPEQDFSNYRFEFEHCFLHFNPIGTALETMLREHAPGWHSHFELLSEDQEVVTESLKRSTEISEDDYFRLSVRFDTLQHIESILMAKAAAEGKQNQVFQHEAYDAEIARQSKIQSKEN